MRSWRALIAALVIAAVPYTARAEVSELNIPLGAGGFGFLPLDLMQKYKLVEKYAADAGMKVTVNWPRFGGAAVMNDALLSGSASVMSAGPPAFLILWDRTRSNLKVKALAAISSIPQRVTARITQLKSLDNISAGQKIAVAGTNVSIASITMQMYAMQKFGKDQVFRFDPFTVNMTHPDALTALLSGTSNIVAHGSSPPFDQRELKDPNIRTILNSYDVMGGGTTFTMMSTTTKFYTENPRLCAVIVKALKRAQEMISKDPREAASLLLESMGGKGWTLDEFVGILKDPDIRYGSKPENVLAYANFMYKIGSLKSKPASLADLFFNGRDIEGGT